MSTVYDQAGITLHHGDCLEVLRSLPDASVDAVVTDPPYGLEFMGKEWDGADGFRRSLNPNDAGRDNAFGRTSKTSPEYRTDSKAAAGMSGTGYTDGATRLDRPSYLGGLNPKCRVCEKWQRGGNPCTCEMPDFPNERLPRLHSFQEWCEAWSRECLRVLKPGGHMLAFGGTRTWHRLACAVEDVGFEVRDSIAWLYGSGFPKSLDVSKAIDKAAGAERQVVGSKLHLPGYHLNGHDGGEAFGHGLSSSTTETRLTSSQITAPATPDAERWQGWGTALKPAFEPIVVARKPLIGTVATNVLTHGTGALNVDGCRVSMSDQDAEFIRKTARPNTSGQAHIGDVMNRPAAPTVNVHAAGRWPANVVLDEDQAAVLDATVGELSSGLARKGDRAQSRGGEIYGKDAGYMRSGDTYGDSGGASRFFYTAKADSGERVRIDGIAHPTVKPLSLMRWLVRLVTPPGGVVLEPFAGSGTTVEACLLEGFDCIAIEREADYLPLIRQRINRRRDPVEAVKASGDDEGLFGLLDGGAA